MSLAETAPRRVVLVSGLSGAGKSSILRTLEDLGYEAVDNLPLAMVEEIVGRGERWLAIGVDSRTRGFCPDAALATLACLRGMPGLRVELVYASADETALLRRYAETRRRHPMAPQGRVADGIAAEQALTASLRAAADLVVDTSELPPAGLRRLIEQRFGPDEAQLGLIVLLVSFAYPAGLPREADLVFDVRFLRNPHYDPVLRPRTGLDAEVGAYVEADADFSTFWGKLLDLLGLLLPRFQQEGKKYATIAVGCTGGRHRSVHIVEKLAAALAGAGWRVTRTHRELTGVAGSPDGGAQMQAGTGRAAPSAGTVGHVQRAVQAQEA
ncbi:MAG: RNase adapter RapZ [Acidisphaera sp.]|nr:RNase adapter RapZ [Acidisphaera sp.]